MNPLVLELLHTARLKQEAITRETATAGSEYSVASLLAFRLHGLPHVAQLARESDDLMFEAIKLLEAQHG